MMSMMRVNWLLRRLAMQPHNLSRQTFVVLYRAVVVRRVVTILAARLKNADGKTPGLGQKSGISEASIVVSRLLRLRGL